MKNFSPDDIAEAPEAHHGDRSYEVDAKEEFPPEYKPQPCPCGSVCQ